MLSLYRSGRQAEALEAYRRARRVFADELGIEPSRPLQELEPAILAQDPHLDYNPPSTARAQYAAQVTVADPGILRRRGR
jgi:DNA-binding SARP family transcriptional activator